MLAEHVSNISSKEECGEVQDSRSMVASKKKERPNTGTGQETHCGRVSAPTPNPCTEILTANGIVFRGGSLGHDSGALVNGTFSLKACITLMVENSQLQREPAVDPC